MISIEDYILERPNKTTELVSDEQEIKRSSRPFVPKSRHMASGKNKNNTKNEDMHVYARFIL